MSKSPPAENPPRSGASRGRIHAAAHQLLEDGAGGRGEHRIRHSRLLKPEDVHLLVLASDQLAHHRGGRLGRPPGVGRVHADHARGPFGMQDRHRPDDEPTPVVSAEDRLLDLEGVEQTGHVAAQVVDVVVGDRLGPIAGAVAPLVRRDGPEARLGQGGELVTPGVGELGEAVTEHHGRAASGLVDGEGDLRGAGAVARGARRQCNGRGGGKGQSWSLRCGWSAASEYTRAPERGVG